MFLRVNLFRATLNAEVAHNGRGEILTKRFVDAQTCDGQCNFIDYTIMPPGTTIGLHTHEASQEEYYLVLEGAGRMTANGQSFDVAAGDLIRNPPGGTHGLENTGSVPIKLFVFEVESTR